MSAEEQFVDANQRLAALVMSLKDQLGAANVELDVTMSVLNAERRDNRELTAELAASREAHRRVVENEGNHYDRYWTPVRLPLTDEWLGDTEAKMREALTDAFCDDAAAVMLTLIAEIQRNRIAMGFAANFVRAAFVDNEEATVKPEWVDEVLAHLALGWSDE